jgi:hypothetical protein
MVVPTKMPDELSINGMYLKVYLDLITESTDAFKTKDAAMYHLYAHKLKSLITDDDRVRTIETAMQKKRDELAKDKKMDENTKIFMECFCVEHECMRFLDHTLKITKRNVEINADQDDDLMPEQAMEKE